VLLRSLLSLMLFVFCQTSVLACDNKLICIEEDNWSIGVAFGIGARTNPLVDGNDIPLVVLPDIAWYSDHAYFDNGEFGYQWQFTDSVTTETFIRTNTERAYFSFWHPSNLIPIQASSSGSDTPGSGGSSEFRYISVDDIASRQWSVDGGIRVNWFDDNQRWSFSVVHDALSVHNGYSVGTAYRRDFFFNDWTVSTSLSVNYKSKNLIDYYYGISLRDTQDNTLWYEAKQTVQVTAGLFVSKQINEKWQWLGRLQATTLGSGMSDSPLVNKDHVTNVFLGIGYRF